jgi:IS1 family transposase
VLWAAPAKNPLVGKTHTVYIERVNSDTRHHFGRFREVVSKSEVMIDFFVRIQHAETSIDRSAKMD